MFRYLLLFSFVIASIGCQPGPKGSADGPSYLTYNESEFAKDYRNLELAEQSLLSVGLKFKKTADSTNDLSIYVWDTDVLKDGSSSVNQQMALNSFIEMAELFLNKYSRPFFVNLEKENATLFRQIKPNFQADLIGKISKSKSSLIETGT